MKTAIRFLPFLALTLALALDPLSSITDAQDGSAGQAPGEAPRPDVAPRAALLTGDVVTDQPLGPLTVRVERVPGSNDHVRLVAKSSGDAADLDVEVTCNRTSGSLASRMGPRMEQVAKERHHVHVAAGEQQLVELATVAPRPPSAEHDGNQVAVFLRESTWWSYQIRLVGGRWDHEATPLVASTTLSEPLPAAAGLPTLVAAMPQAGSPSK